MSGVALAGSVLAPMVGGALGAEAARGDRDAANRAALEALKQFSQINVPTMEQQQLILEQLKSQGQLTPEMEQAISQGRTEFDNVATDPRLKQAQLQALAEMQNIGAQGGMNASDRAQWAKVQSDLGQQQGAQQAAIMQDMARRGQAGSGMELAAQLMGQQQNAQVASQQGMDIKAQAERRALEALMQSGQMGGQIRSQDYQEQAGKAQAQDAINRFNVQNRQQVMGSNVAARNAAQASNLGERQRIADSNVNLRNQQQTHNKGLYQQQFENQMAKAGGMSGQYNNMAANSNASADRQAGAMYGIGNAIGSGLGAYNQYQQNDDLINRMYPKK